MTNQLQEPPREPRAYQPSIPAVHAARILLRNFIPRELGKIEATEHNLAALVDYSSQIFRVTAAVDRVVRSAAWNDERNLTANLDRLREAVLSLEEAATRLPKFTDGASETNRGNQYEISATALHCARFLCQHFLFARRAKLAPTEKNIAIIIDVCTQAFRIEGIIHKITASRLWLKPSELRKNLDELRTALRATELVNNYVPNQVKSRVVVHEARTDEEVRLTADQKKELERFAKLVAEARTVQQEQALLQKAGFVSR